MIGGQETYIHFLNKILHKHNYQPYVLQPFNRSIDTPKNVIMLPFIPFLNAFFSPWLTTNFLVRFLKKRLLQFDLLISHYALHYNSVRKNKNVIVVSHGTDWHDPPITKLDKARYKAAMGLKNMKENRPIIVANDTHFLQKIGINISSTACTFTEIEKNVWFIPNCVDGTIFKPTDLDRKKQILVPRNVRTDRGIHLAIEAFNLFNKKHIDYQLIIAGDFNILDSYYQECLKLTGQNEVKDRIVFLGKIDHEKMMNLYQESCMSLIPTIEIEGTSLSALESMACKTPTISTSAGGLSDLPTLKCDFTPQGLCDKMEEIKNNWNTYSEEQHKITSESFNIDHWEKAWIKVIQNSLN